MTADADESSAWTRRAQSGVNAAMIAMFALLLVGYTINAMDRQVFPTLLVAVLSGRLSARNGALGALVLALVLEIGRASCRERV